MPTYQPDQFTDNQAVDPAISDASDKDLLKLISQSISTSDIYRNQFAIMSDSWAQDAGKYEALYNGKLYDKRQKMSYECKEDIYRDLVDFNSTLLNQYEYSEFIQQIGEQPYSISADLFGKFLEYADNLDDAQQKEEDCTKLSGQMGVGIYKFKPFQCEGYWWPGVEVVDPRQVFISPGASSFKDAVFCGWKRPVPTSELKAKFPDKAKAIKPDASISDADYKSQGNGGGIISVQYLNGIQNFANNVVGMFDKSPKLQTMLTEFYYMDPQTQEITSDAALMVWVASNPGFGTAKFSQCVIDAYRKQMSDSMNSGTKLTVKKYPFGRMILSTNDLVLNDVANPYYRFPFFEQKCFARPKAFWAKGVCEVVREPVQNYHLLMASLAMNLDYNLRPVYQEISLRGDAGGKLKQIATQPNSIMQTNGEIKPIATGPIAPAGVLEVAGIRKQNWENTSGLNSVLGGVNPTGNYSSLQLENLKDGALGKVTPRLRQKNRCLKQLGEMKLWFVQNFCCDEREIYFMDKDQMEEAVVNRYTVDGGKPVTQNDVTIGKYKYVIDIDVKKPVSQATRAAQYADIAKIFAQISPVESFRLQLQAMDIPGKEQIIARFEAAVQQKTQMEAQQKQAQIQVQQQQIASNHANMERKLDIEEIKAGASVQEAVAWIIVNMQKAGLGVTPEVMSELANVAQQTNAVSGAALQTGQQNG